VSWQIVPTIVFEMLQDKNAKKRERVMQAVLEMIKLDVKALKKAYKGKPASAAAGAKG
jgi:predicted 3-demethylubiquinone-9 3-methyltransferase (glyoxalase superfamily)